MKEARDRTPPRSGFESMLLTHLLVAGVVAVAVLEVLRAQREDSFLGLVGVAGTLIGWFCLAARPD